MTTSPATSPPASTKERATTTPPDGPPPWCCAAASATTAAARRRSRRAASSADWDAKAERLTVWDTTQAPVVVRNGLAAMLGLSERQVRVVAPFIGGGFGPKIMMFYPEEVLLPWLAIRLDRPVKWIEDRAEHFLATTQERSQIHDAEIALARDGRILGIRDEFLHDSGAYDPYGLTVPLNSQCTLLGPYVVPAYDSRFTAIFTTLPIVSPYRGAGRQHGVFVIERLLDIAARELGLDRAEIRRRNFIAPDAFPYDNHIIYQDFAPLHYDSGDYGPVLDKALDAIGYRAFIAEEQPRLRAEGRRVGIGVVFYVEGTGIGPYEGARVQVQGSGRVLLATGIGTQGQGHFTSFAQIVADQIGVAVSDIDVVTGDTDQFHWGVGTFASRGAVVAGNATHAAAKQVRAKILRTAAEHFECAEADLLLADGQVAIKGVPQRNIALGALAALANPLRGAVQPGTEPGLEATAYFGPAKGATAAGAHAMIVEIDPATMELRILKYVVVHDCGTVINPLIVAGQIQGGVAQGIGNAFYERLVVRRAGPAHQRHPGRLSAADRGRSAEDRNPPPRHALAIQRAGRQGGGRGRRNSRGRAVRPGDRGRAGAARARHRHPRDTARPQPSVGACRMSPPANGARSGLWVGPGSVWAHPVSAKTTTKVVSRFDAMTPDTRIYSANKGFTARPNSISTQRKIGLRAGQ